MVSAAKVFRGGHWAEPLCQVLGLPPADAPGWMEQHTRLIKIDTCSRVGLLELQQQPCFLKLYLAKSPVQSLGFRLGYGRALRSFDAATRMHGHGLPVPMPRTCVSVPGGMMLLTEAIADSQDLRALWLTQPTAKMAQRLMQCAGEVLAALHRQGFAHGDCKWSNLLWNGERFHLVDLEAVRRVKSPTSALSFNPRQIRDLARFTIDAEELGAQQNQYDIFLEIYCASTNCSREQLVAALAPAAEPVRRRHAKKYGKDCEPLV